MIYLQKEQLAGKVLVCDSGFCFVTVDGLSRRMRQIQGESPLIGGGDLDGCKLHQMVEGRRRAKCFNAEKNGYQVDEKRSIR